MAKPTYPLAHRVDTSHRYTPAAATDIRKTFARIRREQAKTREAESTVVPMPTKTRRTGN